MQTGQRHSFIVALFLLLSALCLPHGSFAQTPPAASATHSESEAAGTLMQVPSGRGNARIPVFLHATANATATLVLLPGGAGGIGRVGESGWPDGTNFLIRSGTLFAAQGFNIAMVSRPDDQGDMTYPFRVSAAHMDDLEHVLRQVRQMWGQPVWLVGTSRGARSR